MTNSPNLRVILIQFLFSLTIGQIALKTGDAIAFGATMWQHHYIYLHILLCVVILSTSWVGWQLSQASENSEKINSVYSWQYIILLVDIFLVISYFVIVRDIEIDGNQQIKISEPKVSNSVFWAMIIFLVYFIWDILTKGLVLSYEPVKKKENVYVKRTPFIISSQVVRRSLPSFICFCVAFFIYQYMAGDGSPAKSSLIYCLLIILFFIFRGLKQEVKKNYKLKQEQIPESLLDNLTFPLHIEENKYMSKFFVIKVVPSICFVICYLFYYNLK